jgi:transposase InsO family protein
VASGRNQEKKSQLTPVSRTADYPGQALNVDLLFVPACHQVDVKLPAVSGSSGHLVIERIDDAEHEPDYPGKVFGNPDLSYAEAMQAFAEASQPMFRQGLDKLDPPAQQPSGERKPEKVPESLSQQAKIRLLRQKIAEERTKRRQVRQIRKMEDAAWRKKPTSETSTQPKQQAPWDARKKQMELERALREQRRLQLALRKQEDEQWRLERKQLREQMNLLPIVTAWIAILVVTDNCTRQCLGLPLFIAGSHVTAEMIVAALRVLLPQDLQFLISDRGVHFTADVFRQLAKDANFVHVVIARHRPQSNGIAERFVRTIKEWLADKAWVSDQELSLLLGIFLPEYNDRPHQGLPCPGLSPNEFAKRVFV